MTSRVVHVKILAEIKLLIRASALTKCGQNVAESRKITLIGIVKTLCFPLPIVYASHLSSW